MNVTELYELTLWIEHEIEGRKIVKLYQNLHGILSQNAQPNQQQQPFEEQKATLISTLEKVDLTRLTIDQLRFLEKLNIAQHVGHKGISDIEDILFRNAIDIATAATRVQEIVQDISKGLEKKNQIKTGLEGCIETEVAEPEQALIRISFEGEAKMSNVVDFKKWGTEWHDIGRGIAMAHGEPPENIRIVGATKGSIIIELAVIYGIAKTVGAIIIEALKVAERVLDIRRKAEEIRGMKLSNDKIAGELEEQADKERSQGIDHITKNVTKELGIKADGDGERIEAFDRSVKKLVNFIEKGGEIDCVVPEEEAAEEGDLSPEETDRRQQVQELRTAFQNIRALEAKLRHIEHNKEP